MKRSGSILVLAGLVFGLGCGPKRGPAKPYPAPPVLGLQTALAIDKQGNQVVAGSFRGELNIGDGKLASVGGTDIFVIKTGPKGDLVFPPQRFGGKGDDAVTDVAIDEDGNIVLVGTFQGEATFGAKPTKANVRHDGQRAVFAAKLDAAGNVLWVKQIAVANLPTQVSVAIRPDKSIVVGASTTGTLASSAGQKTLGGESVVLELLAPSGDSLPLPAPFAPRIMSLTTGCTHSPCHEGAALNPACGFYGCVARICEDDSWCCTVEWDDRCVAEMAWCHHRCDCNQVFTSGEPFYPDASPCVAAVYSLGLDGTGDHYCSEVWWDGLCVAETGWPAITASCHPACQ